MKLMGANQSEALVTEQCCSVTLTSNTATANIDLQAASLSPGALPVSIRSHNTQKQLLAGSLCIEENANHLYYLIKIIKKEDVKNLQ